MGSGRFTPDDWKGYASTRGYATTPTGAIDPSIGVGTRFRSSAMDPSLSPHGIKGRESCDSADNPNSTAMIVGLDVTGSMGMLSSVIHASGLKTLMEEVYTRKPISDPHLMFMGIGDATCDQAPLQITQFEADIRIAEQLEKLWLEGGGGGNRFESYMLPWYFAAHHTTIDCFEKRGKKGYLFTIGDEEPCPSLSREQIQTVLGYTPETAATCDELLTLVSRKWEVFHIMVAEGSHARSYPDVVRSKWTNLLGQRAIWLTDHTKLAETIVSILQIHEGADHDAVVKSWDGTTAMVVGKATEGLVKKTADAGGVVTL